MRAAYARLNSTHPLATKSTISGTLLGAADLTCQWAEAAQEKRKAGIDLARTGRIASWGLLVNGPTGHAFYSALERLVTQRGARGVVQKVAIDQLVYTPPLTFAFFVYQGVAAGSMGTEALELAQRETWPTLLYNWAFWSVAHIVTFSAIPLEHRVAWVALKNFVWSGFLSWRLSTIESTASMQSPSSSACSDSDMQGATPSGEAAAAGLNHTHSASLMRRCSTSRSAIDSAVPPSATGSGGVT